MLQLSLILLIALIAGAALYIWAVRSKGAGILFAKILGIILIVLSVLGMIGTIFYSMGYSRACPIPGAAQNAIKQKAGRLEGRLGPSGTTVVNPAANTRVEPAPVPNRSLNRELRRGGIYHKNH